MTCIIAKIRWDGTARKNVLLPLSGESFNPCRNYWGITCLLRFASRKWAFFAYISCINFDTRVVEDSSCRAGINVRRQLDSSATSVFVRLSPQSNNPQCI